MSGTVAESTFITYLAVLLGPQILLQLIQYKNKKLSNLMKKVKDDKFLTDRQQRALTLWHNANCLKPASRIELSQSINLDDAAKITRYLQQNHSESSLLTFNNDVADMIHVSNYLKFTYFLTGTNNYFRL